MKVLDKIKHYISPSLLGGVGVGIIMLLMAACTADENAAQSSRDGALELKSIEAEIVGGNGTRSSVNYKDLGKKEFADGDLMMLTTIKRTQHEINDFSSVTGIQFKYAVDNTQDPPTKQWKRTNQNGEPERIYWTDPSSPHTIVAYSTPSPDFTANKWKKNTVEQKDTYYSGIGDITKTNQDEPSIDFTSGNNSIIAEDMLVSHDAGFQPNVNAKLLFHHALASVKVVVNIRGFAQDADPADAGALSKNMVLKSMPTLYKWDMLGNAASPLVEADYSIFHTLYSSSANADNRKKNIKMWDSGTDGEKADRTSTFYALAVPGTLNNGLNMDFELEYQDPRKPVDPNDPNSRITVPYSAQLAGAVNFVAGKCTQINISVNHTNGTTTVGVVYVDWEYDNGQELSELRKHSPYLTEVVTTNVTTHIETNIEQATWLYTNGGKIYDIDGNDGTAEHPFSIKSAKQFLSLKKEVEDENTYDFDGKFIDLDVNLVMQPSLDANSLSWESIGKGTTPKTFNGTMICHGSISRLQGEPLFAKLGPNAHIQDLRISTLGIEGTGATGVLASESYGRICACIATGDIKGGDYTGSIVGKFYGGTIFASSHQGKVTSTGTHAGGLIGQIVAPTTNKGIIVASYHAGVVTSGSGGSIGGIYGEYIDFDHTTVTFRGNYYDKNLLDNPLDDPNHGVTGKTTTELQSPSFVGSQEKTNISDGINGAIHLWVKEELTAGHITQQQAEHYNSHYYQYVPLNYPKAY